MDLSKLKALEEQVRKAQQDLDDKRTEVATEIGLHALDLGAADLPPDVLTGAILGAVEAHKTGSPHAATLAKASADFRSKNRKPGRPKQAAGGNASGSGGGASSAGASSSARAEETPSHVTGE